MKEIKVKEPAWMRLYKVYYFEENITVYGFLSMHCDITDPTSLDAALSPVTKSKPNGTKTRASPSKPLNNDARSDDVQSLLSQLSSEDWRIRMQMIESVIKFVEENPDKFFERHAVQRLFDTYLERCRDGNSKVTAHALEQLSRLIAALKVKILLG